MSTDSVAVTYFSDVLCVWAYAAQVKVDELRRQFGERVAVDARFCSVFGNSARKIERGWSARGGRAAYAAHVREIAGRFELPVHPDVWDATVPAGSMACHALVKAVGLAAGLGQCREGRSLVEEMAWRLRVAFFEEGRDVARLDVGLHVAATLGLEAGPIREQLDSGAAAAALAVDYEVAAEAHLQGSPTFLLNEGRQILYGNVGYRVLEANVQELLDAGGERASWC